MKIANIKRIVMVIFIVALITTGISCKKQCKDYTNPDCSNYDAKYAQIEQLLAANDAQHTDSEVLKMI